MKTLIHKIFIAFVLFGAISVMTAQVENRSDSELSYFSLSVNYISDAIFMGRKDSIAAPYLYPTLLYHHKSGFYASSSISYLTKADEGRIDLFVVTGGFDFTIKKFNGDISFTGYGFNADSYNVISEVGSDITALLGYDFEILNLSLSASNYFNRGGSSDVFLSTELSSDFITTNKKFQFSPTAGIYFGSQNFYEQYFVNNRFGNGRGQSSGQGQGNSGGLQPTTVVFNESEKFKLMAIDFSLPIWFAYKSFYAVVVPTYVIPQNEASLNVDENLVKENLDASFYFIAGVYYLF